ncbi:insulinase family protein [Fimbriimonas ginsengisoli]|uniref:Insulinase family protein n=1 Tax=Fimbriimonas ginsengisoli Gsoil 348 TaxID=661478 RepID=A0A068NVL8_FIMGI|nr:insulinase family protein [Fimbriimonas ginsengisoli]AIE87538.1 hypothetical protein OP10G_4170 [Fimbriimonas ginsengisoli Gsoil 348]
MILFAAALFAGLVVENVEPGAREVSIQAIARIPNLTARQADSLDALVEAIPREVEGYARRDILTVTGGDPVRCSAGPDYVRISFHVPPANLREGLSLMEALCRSSRLTVPAILPSAKATSWVAALRPYERTRNPRPSEVQDLYHALFRPENITLGVGGPVKEGEAEENWSGRMDKWITPRLPEPSKYEALPKPLAKNPGGVSTIELTGPTFGAGDAAISTRILALIALGSGKGASLFRVARRQLGMSYRQEALLYPVPDGWQSRILLETSATDGLDKQAEALRAALVEDVKGWTDADLKRARGMAEAVFLRGVDFSPFAFGPAGTFDDTLEGRTFLRTYWRLKTGEPWDAKALVKTMQVVTLDDLREIALGVLTEGKTRVLPAG